MVMNDVVPSGFLRVATSLFHSPKSNVLLPFWIKPSATPGTPSAIEPAGMRA
jgi:hypothetical protein